MSLQTDLVSVITPVFNSERFIADTIRSVQAQSYSQWELLVLIDQGTSDRTAEIVGSFASQDARIRLIDVPGGRSVSDARNYGFQMACGRYVAFLDADDLWLPDKLERQLALMQKTGAALCYGGFRRVTEDGRSDGREIHVPATLSYHDLLKHNHIACLTAVVDQSQTGPLHMGTDQHEDYSLWLKILRSGHHAVGVQNTVARYRVVKGSRSSRKLLMAAWRWQTYRQDEGLSVVRSLYYFSWYIFLTLGKHLKF